MSMVTVQVPRRYKRLDILEILSHRELDDQQALLSESLSSLPVSST